ncbi:helix-turn-helix transcriptional regulator [Jiulongibacter sp. NS-SX5]|uniref:helix-turn-helix transcriptional regulator n=1 Tax=Jiulongibacter sp. NS-SX5 TaxID=3463854 RepID=UPI004059C333
MSAKGGSEGQIYQRKISSEVIWENALMNNSLFINSIEKSSDDTLSFVSGLDFTDKKAPLQKDSDILLQCKEPVVKIHFSLEGNYSFKPLSHIDYRLQIPENHCNLILLQDANYTEYYPTDNSKAFELFIKPRLLKEALGLEYSSQLAGLSEAIVNSNTHIHWDKSKFIPPHIRNRIMDILLCPYSGKLRTQYIEGNLIALLIDFFLARQQKDKPERHTKLSNADYLSLVKVETHIRKNLKRPLRILDLTEVAGFNATKLKRDFKKVYGITIFKYITTLRMEKAVKLISEENLPISQASYEVGFSHPQHFTTAFKRTMGYLPSQLKPLE